VRRSKSGSFPGATPREMARGERGFFMRRPLGGSITEGWLDCAAGPPSGALVARRAAAQAFYESTNWRVSLPHKRDRQPASRRNAAASPWRQTEPV
jgi:hypothetical protein